MGYTPTFKRKYQEEIIPALQKEFNYKSVMQVPELEKIILKFRNLHNRFVVELFLQGRNNLLLIFALKSRCVSHYLISSPDFFEYLTSFPSLSSLRPIRVGFPVLGSFSIKFETWIDASCLMMPPCGCLEFGFVCLDTRLTPSTMARSFSLTTSSTFPSE